MATPTLYSVMTGLQAITRRQSVQANNLVNADTPGFRAELSTVIADPIRGPSADRGQADAIAGNNGYSRHPGPLKHTGADWDIAITNGGWLVTRSATGRIELTQDGRLHLGQDGLLEDSHGDDVLGANFQPISLPPLKSLKIGSDGTVSGVPVGSGSQLAQQFDRIYIAATPAEPLQPLGNGSFGGVASTRMLTRATQAGVRQGYLDGSNVNPTRIMTDLIADVRTFQTETALQRSTEQAAAGLDVLIARG